MFRAAAYPLMFVALLGLLLVPVIVRDPAGQRRRPAGWSSARFPFQPSELAKFAFLLWGADLLARKDKLAQLDDWRHLLIPLLPGVGFLCHAGHARRRPGHHVHPADHLPGAAVGDRHPGPRLYVGILALIGLALLIMLVVAPYRFDRLPGFLTPAGQPGRPEPCSPSRASGRSGSGGWFGVGLGASTAEVGLGAR